MPICGYVVRSLPGAESTVAARLGLQPGVDIGDVGSGAIAAALDTATSAECEGFERSVLAWPDVLAVELIYCNFEDELPSQALIQDHLPKAMPGPAESVLGRDKEKDS